MAKTRTETISLPASKSYVAEFIAAYMDTALWSSGGSIPCQACNGSGADGELACEECEGNGWFDADSLEGAGLTNGDLSDECRATMIAECLAFIWANRRQLRASKLDAGRAGHDFWLNRNGHGAGFWDEGLGAIGEDLSRAAKSYGTADLYVGDDGKVEVM